MKSSIVDFFPHFIRENTPQNNFYYQNFNVQNNYLLPVKVSFNSPSILYYWTNTSYHDSVDNTVVGSSVSLRRTFMSNCCCEI